MKKEFSFFSAPISNLHPAKAINLIEAYQIISQINYKPQTERLRSLKDKTSQDKYKASNFDYCTFRGVFGQRNAKSIKQVSGYFDIDIDKLENVETIFSTLQADPYCALLFRSPSGKGLKFIAQIETRAFDDKEATKVSYDFFFAFEAYFREKYGLKIDEQCKDIARACFVCFDKNAFLNENSEVFYLPQKAKEADPIAPKTKIKVEKKQAKTAPPDPAPNAPTDIEIFEWCLAQHSKNKPFANGQRNKFVNGLAVFCLERGCSYDTVLSESLARFTENDFSEKEITATINSVWTNKAHLANTKPFEAKKDKEKAKDAEKEPAKDAEKEPAKDAENTNPPRFVQIKNYLVSNYELCLNTVANTLLGKAKNAKEFSALNENDLNCELYEIGFKGFKDEIKALIKSDKYVPKYDPIRAYFEALPKFDNIDHIEALANYVVCTSEKEQKNFNHHFKKALVRTIAGALHLIDYNKHCFTLTGGQNNGKSSFIKFLCPPALLDYYQLLLEFKGDKDERAMLYQNFIINLDELSALSKVEIDKIKAFITMPTVKDRLPYDSKPSVFFRIASFFASTNQTEFLTDTTGNVRWLVFQIAKINHDNGGAKGYSQNIEIDKAWAQAYHLLQSGFEFRLTEKEIKYSEEQNRNYQVQTTEIQLISEKFAPATPDQNDNFLSTTKMMEIVCAAYPFLASKISLKKFGEALRFLGFELKSKRKNSHSNPENGYYVKYL